MRYRQSGFTLIELMIVVAIIGVLSSIAIPAYKNYVTKSELASGLSTLKALTTPAEIYYQQHGNLPSGNLSTELGIASDANPLGTISTTTNTLIFTFDDGSAISNTTIEFQRGGTNSDSADTEGGWECQITLSEEADADLIPKGCTQANN